MDFHVLSKLVFTVLLDQELGPHSYLDRIGDRDDCACRTRKDAMALVFQFPCELSEIDHVSHVGITHHTTCAAVSILDSLYHSIDFCLYFPKEAQQFVVRALFPYPPMSGNELLEDFGKTAGK